GHYGRLRQGKPPPGGAQEHPRRRPLNTGGFRASRIKSRRPEGEKALRGGPFQSQRRGGGQSSAPERLCHDCRTGFGSYAAAPAAKNSISRSLARSASS